MAKFNADYANQIDQDTVESDGQQYPAISFHNGDQTQKKAGGISYFGGWFIAEEGAPADMTAYGWIKDSFISRNSGTEIVGYWASTISVSVIHSRKRWLTQDRPFAWDDYEAAKKSMTKGSPRGHQQYLVLLKGAEDLGPFVIGLKGHAGMCFSGSRQYASNGALSCFNRTVIAAANAASKPAKWPFRAFWLSVGSVKNAKGDPQFVEVGSDNATSKIVLPLPIGLPDKADKVALDDFYVGDDLLATVEQIFTETLTWKAAWDSFTQAEHRSDPRADEVVATTDELAEMGV